MKASITMHHTSTASHIEPTDPDSSFAAPRRFVEDEPRPLAALWKEAAQALAARRARQAALAKTPSAPAARTPQEIRRERVRYQFD